MTRYYRRLGGIPKGAFLARAGLRKVFDICGKFSDSSGKIWFPHHKSSGFPRGSFDTAAADGRSGSNVYEVNPWLWQFGVGTLDVGSRAWVVCQWRRLLTGRMLLKRNGLGLELRLAGVARLIGPDLK